MTEILNIYSYNFKNKQNLDYDKIANTFFDLFNFYHSKNFPQRTNEILLGDWTFRSLKIINRAMDFYYKLKFNNNDKNFNSNISIYNTSYDLFNNEQKINNEILYLIDSLKNNKKICYNNSDYICIIQNSKLRYLLQNIINKFYVFFGVNTLVYEPCIGKFNEIKLNFKLNKLPFIYKILPQRNYKQPNKKKRLDLENQIPKNFSEDDKLIIKILIYICPLSYFENFHDNINYVNKAIPKSIKKIFLTDGIYSDDFIKTYLATNIDKIKIFIAQHGMHNVLEKIAIEEKICDFFLSYSKFNISSKRLQFGIINKPYLKQIKHKPYHNKKIINFFPPISDNFYIDEITKNELLKYLVYLENKKIKNILKFHSKKKKIDQKLVNQKLKNLKILNENKSYYSQLHNYKFACFHYFSTGFIELMAMDYPVLLICRKDELDLLSEKKRKILIEMQKNRLIFFDYNSLEANIEDICNNLEHIWYKDKDIKSLKDDFRNNFGYYDPSFLTKLYKILK